MAWFGLGERITNARRVAQEAALDFLVDRVKDTLNVPRPPGVKRNPPGNPPFLKKGRLRQSVDRVTIGGNPVIVYPAVNYKGFAYGSYHEQKGWNRHGGAGNHPFVAPTAAKFANELKGIIQYTFWREMLWPSHK